MLKSKREFGEGPIFTITSYIYWLFMGNFYFVLLNIPLVLILISILSNGTNPLPKGFSVIIFLSCIPIGPAATALFSVMGKLIREKDINITNDFFKAYKVNFSESLFLWTFEMVLIAILFIYTRLFIAQNYPPILTIFMYIAIVFIFMMGLYVFPILSRFYLGPKELVKLSAYNVVANFHITILNIVSFAIVGFIFIKISTFVLVFSSSIICFLIMFYEQKILTQIEQKFNSTSSESCNQSANL